MWGHVLPGNDFQITCSEMVSEAILGAVILGEQDFGSFSTLCRGS